MLAITVGKIDIKIFKKVLLNVIAMSQAISD
jgi:hypothetical protein